MKDHNININKNYFYKSDIRMHNGWNIVNEISKTDDRPSALFCVSDELAIGMISALFLITLGITSYITSYLLLVENSYALPMAKIISVLYFIVYMIDLGEFSLNPLIRCQRH